MKYFQVERTSEIKFIGVKDGMSQVERLEDEIKNNQDYIDFKNHFSRLNNIFWTSQENTSNLKPPVIKGRMRKNAKLTDVMWYGPVFSFLNNIYSEKYINIIKTFNIDLFNVFEFQIEEISEMYYLMFLKTVTLDEIYFDKSVVTTGYKVNSSIKYHKIKTKDEFILFQENNPICSFEKIVVPEEYFGKDIINIQSIGKHFYSERLINFLIVNKINGLQIFYDNSIELGFCNLPN